MSASPVLYTEEPIDVDTLAVEIKADLAAEEGSVKDSVEHARSAGEKLKRVQDDLKPKKEWYAWLKRHEIDDATAQRRILIFDSWSSIPLTVRDKGVAACENWCRRQTGAGGSSIIKASDLWTFNPPFYGRIDGEDKHGYIPGDLYANMLWYGAEEGDLVCDPMAGSGQVFRVYEDRARWLPSGCSLEVDLRLFDLNPRGPYADRIGYHDARTPLPITPDLILMDLPYYAIARGSYSQSEEDIANAEDFPGWLEMIAAVALACRKSQETGRGRVMLIIPSFREERGEGFTRIPVPRHVQRLFEGEGYELRDVFYSGRAIQKYGEKRFINAHAKKSRSPLTEVAEIQFYQRDHTPESA